MAIIMDGNGRWARQHRKARKAGHRRGVEAARRTIRAAMDMGVQYLTLYGFSTENWSRPLQEVRDLMGLLRGFIRSDLAQLRRAGVRVRIIGEQEGLEPGIVRLIREAEHSTRANRKLELIIAFNYGGRHEIAAAARRMARNVEAGLLRSCDIDVAVFDGYLNTTGAPPPDLIIRTSGEQRLSNFLLWQSAYAELVFMDVLWPDFGPQMLARAIGEFHARDRRFGARPQDALRADAPPPVT